MREGRVDDRPGEIPSVAPEPPFVTIPGEAAVRTPFVVAEVSFPERGVYQSRERSLSEEKDGLKV
jgi:hypothetical protein